MPSNSSGVVLPVSFDLSTAEREIQNFIRTIPNVNIPVKIDPRPLGAINGQVQDFTRSIDAAAARTISFGLTVGVIGTLASGFRELVKSTIEVNTALTQINSILGLSDRSLSAFSKSLFDIAKNTGQTFQQTSEIANAFARQVDGAAEVLKRTNAALILTRVSGLDANDAVKVLTASLATYKDELGDVNVVLNKIIAADIGFAVSSRDVAEGISRSASSAKDAKVSFDELIALITSAQSSTQRGGAVIGNALKTIFTKIDKPEVLDQLEQLGISVRNINGSTLPAVQILTQLAQTYDHLSDAQKSNITQLVGSTYQINTLKATLNDLSNQYSTYNRALNASINAGDTAINRNALLNKSYASLANSASANFTSLASKAGDLTVGPLIKNVLGGFNNASDSIGSTDTGKRVAEGFLKGIGDYISGPGLILAGALGLKFFGQFASFALKAGESFAGIGVAGEKQKAVLQGVNGLLQQQPELYSKILSVGNNRVKQEQLVLELIEQQNRARETQASVASAIGSSLYQRGATFSGGAFNLRAGGFVPNFLQDQERDAAASHGYSAGNVIPFQTKGKDSGLTPSQFINQAGIGRASGFVPNFANSVVNTNEFQLSKAGSNAVGIIPPNDAARIDPIKAASQGYSLNKLGGGFVPNFALDDYNDYSERHLVGIRAKRSKDRNRFGELLLTHENRGLNYKEKEEVSKHLRKYRGAKFDFNSLDTDNFDLFRGGVGFHASGFIPNFDDNFKNLRKALSHHLNEGGENPLESFYNQHAPAPESGHSFLFDDYFTRALASLTPTVHQEPFSQKFADKLNTKKLGYVVDDYHTTSLEGNFGRNISNAQIVAYDSKGEGLFNLDFVASQRNLKGYSSRNPASIGENKYIEGVKAGLAPSFLTDNFSKFLPKTLSAQEVHESLIFAADKKFPQGWIAKPIDARPFRYKNGQDISGGAQSAGVYTDDIVKNPGSAFLLPRKGYLIEEKLPLAKDELRAKKKEDFFTGRSQEHPEGLKYDELFTAPEYRVHVLGASSKAATKVVPYATFRKDDPQKFQGDEITNAREGEEIKKVQAAALEAVQRLPKNERNGVIFGPDVVKLQDGSYRVIELNPTVTALKNQHGIIGASGGLDNVFVRDAVLGFLKGRKPLLPRLAEQFPNFGNSLNYGGGFVPNFNSLHDAISREASFGKQPIIGSAPELGIPIGVYNTDQKSKYGNLSNTIRADHLGQGQSVSTLPLTGSGKEKYTPNFASITDLVGEHGNLLEQQNNIQQTLNQFKETIESFSNELAKGQNNLSQANTNAGNAIGNIRNPDNNARSSVNKNLAQYSEKLASGAIIDPQIIRLYDQIILDQTKQLSKAGTTLTREEQARRDIITAIQAQREAIVKNTRTQDEITNQQSNLSSAQSDLGRIGGKVNSIESSLSFNQVQAFQRNPTNFDKYIRESQRNSSGAGGFVRDLFGRNPYAAIQKDFIGKGHNPDQLDELLGPERLGQINSVNERVSQRRFQGAFLGSIAAPILGGVAGSLINSNGQNPQGEKLANGLGSAVGTFAQFSAFGPQAAVVGGVIASFQAFDAILKSTTPDFDELSKSTNDYKEKQKDINAAAGDFIEAQQNYADAVEKGASSFQLDRLQRKSTATLQNVGDPDLVRQLSGASNVQEQLSVLDKFSQQSGKNVADKQFTTDLAGFSDKFNPESLFGRISRISRAVGLTSETIDQPQKDNITELAKEFLAGNRKNDTATVTAIQNSLDPKQLEVFYSELHRLKPEMDDVVTAAKSAAETMTLLGNFKNTFSQGANQGINSQLLTRTQGLNSANNLNEFASGLAGNRAEFTNQSDLINFNATGQRNSITNQQSSENLQVLGGAAKSIISSLKGDQIGGVGSGRVASAENILNQIQSGQLFGQEALTSLNGILTSIDKSNPIYNDINASIDESTNKLAEIKVNTDSANEKLDNSISIQKDALRIQNNQKAFGGIDTLLQPSKFTQLTTGINRGLQANIETDTAHSRLNTFGRSQNYDLTTTAGRQAFAASQRDINAQNSAQTLQGVKSFQDVFPSASSDTIKSLSGSGAQGAADGRINQVNQFNNDLLSNLKTLGQRDPDLLSKLQQGANKDISSGGNLNDIIATITQRSKQFSGDPRASAEFSNVLKSLNGENDTLNQNNRQYLFRNGPLQKLQYNNGLRYQAEDQFNQAVGGQAITQGIQSTQNAASALTNINSTGQLNIDAKNVVLAGLDIKNILGDLTLSSVGLANTKVNADSSSVVNLQRRIGNDQNDIVNINKGREKETTVEQLTASANARDAKTNEIAKLQEDLKSANEKLATNIKDLHETLASAIAATQNNPVQVETLHKIDSAITINDQSPNKSLTPEDLKLVTDLVNQLITKRTPNAIPATPATVPSK